MNDIKKPILVFAYGNLSRGDDALGPLLLEHIQENSDYQQIELLLDYQLQIEHTLDLQERELVLFIDASMSGDAAFSFKELAVQNDASCTSHAMSPESLLHGYEKLHQKQPPAAFLLGIRGSRFGLGETLSSLAHQHLQIAAEFTDGLLQTPSLAAWRQLAKVQIAANVETGLA